MTPKVVPMKKIFLILSLFLFAPVQGAILLKSNEKLNETSFTFAVKQYAYHKKFRRFFVAAHETITSSEEDKKYALAYINPLDTVFTGIAPEKVSIDGQKGAKNPLFGAGIKRLAILGWCPVVVTKDDQASLYVIEEFLKPDDISLLAAPNINDASDTPEKTNGIIALETTEGEEPNENDKQAFIFAAVKKGGKEGKFGQKGSGIALIKIAGTVDAAKKIKLKTHILDARTAKENGNKAAPLDTQTNAAFIGQPLAAMGPKCHLHWHNDFKVLYIGLSVEAHDGPHNGARALLISTRNVGNKGLAFIPVAPDSVFSGGQQIIGVKGTTGNQKKIAIHAVASLSTSTHLDYLIVNGGVGVRNTRKKVFALPLVNDPNSNGFAQIARKKQMPILYLNKDTRGFIKRTLFEPAQVPADMVTEDESCALVGGGQLPGPVDTLFTSGDTVFVSMPKAPGQQGGIYYSQAIFDQKGLIANWSEWQRAGAAGSIRGFALDSRVGDFLFMSGSAGRVERTQTGLLPISSLISEQFPPDRGGAQGIFDLHFKTRGLSQQPGSRLSIQIITGFQKVLFLETAADNERGVLGERIGGPTLFAATQGSLEGFKHSQAIAISGGVLADLGPITSATLLISGDNGYFIVGGTGGVAVLMNPDGSGFNAREGLKRTFEGLSPSMRFVKISDSPDVIKLAAESDTLYVLTQTSLERLKLGPAQLMSQPIAKSVLTESEGELVFGSNACFFDVAISDGFGLLSTNLGLYHSARTVNLLEAQSSIRWQMVRLPESIGAVTKLVAVSPVQGFAHKGQIYLLNSSISLSQSRIYRLFVDKHNESPVRLLDDLFMEDKPTFFADIGNYRNYFATDGAITLLLRSRYLEQPVLCEVLAPGIKSGTRYLHNLAVNLDLKAPDARALGPIIRSSSSGSWLVIGDFGIRGNA